ncbi:MAG: toll/interleukin-1 receptor domain-containing protein [Candidatus Kerfeldbacteria bacterium]|nr:toll/interleukin-1 receptor domain-containing protein [Candidatus Kerfeldbacteria bacterium]
MRKIDKYNLIDKIARDLQSRMTYSDINNYLKAFDINTTKETSNINSKWVYVKELLAEEDDKIILEIASELNISHDIAEIKLDTSDVSFWKPGHFKLFVSHLSRFKEAVSLLQASLYKYGISCFVAHEDIKPTKEWMTEIEKALFTMDGMIAVLTDGFSDSAWTDQEIGIALGRGIVVIPVIKNGILPYGFLGKYQGLKADNKNVEYVARGIYKILIQNKATRNKILSALSEKLLLANNTETALFIVDLLKKEDILPEDFIENIHINIRQSELLIEENVLREINRLFDKYDFSRITAGLTLEDTISIEDIPF